MKKSIYMLSLVVAIVLSACDGSFIEQQVANDAVKQYELALKGGDKAEISVNAALVAEAYKQANDEKNYLKWKKIAKEAEEAHLRSVSEQFGF